MSRTYLFADESGNFDFSHGTGASRYFILTTIALNDCAVGQALLDLRRTLAWEGVGLNSEFHATTDAQAVRDRVFAAIAPYHFRVDATVLDKARTRPDLRLTDAGFYKAAWELHMARAAIDIVRRDGELLVVGASLGTKRKRETFRNAIEDVMQQLSRVTRYRVASWNGVSDPCLQVADYCCWAIQRKWERNDPRSHALIAAKIATEHAPFDGSTSLYY